jgi:hypothetical protein
MTQLDIVLTALRGASLFMAAAFAVMVHVNAARGTVSHNDKFAFALAVSLFWILGQVPV